jgi:hypothetical protein
MAMALLVPTVMLVAASFPLLLPLVPASEYLHDNCMVPKQFE